MIWSMVAVFMPLLQLVERLPASTASSAWGVADQHESPERAGFLRSQQIPGLTVEASDALVDDYHGLLTNAARISRLPVSLRRPSATLHVRGQKRCKSRVLMSASCAGSGPPRPRGRQPDDPVIFFLAAPARAAASRSCGAGIPCTPTPGTFAPKISFPLRAVPSSKAPCADARSHPAAHHGFARASLAHDRDRLPLVGLAPCRWSCLHRTQGFRLVQNAIS